MRKILLLALGLLCCVPVQAADWSPVADSMLTRWGKQVRPDNVWAQYPRPQMKRDQWKNLNGMWDYAVTASGSAKPDTFDGEILVPFAIEAPLSGVGKRLAEDEALWYHTSFDLSDLKRDSDSPIRLHFEAVDYACDVWVNGEKLGSHIGGNLPFSFLVQNSKASGNELVVKVIDATDAVGKYQLRGKQKVQNRGIFYTPVSGIWQTVWIEPVAANHIESLKVSGSDQGLVTVVANVVGEYQQLRISAKEGSKTDTTIGTAKGVELTIDDPKLWSPDSPTLYDLKVELLDQDGKVLDSVDSYVGLRTVGKRRDADGNLRLTLNGKDIFHWGPLDQGWWPGGLLTPPSEEAITFEIDFLRDAGFNMIRKHIKVEPRRYYYYCDQVGMLVWQDQIEGGAGFQSEEWPKWQRLGKDHPAGNKPQSWKEGDSLDADWPDAAHEQYMVELKGMVDHLYNHPSIVTWVPFNERWGQHRSMEVGEWIKAYDPSRHINIASGGNFFPVGDMADEHVYPHPDFPVDDPRYDDYVKIVGEFGGHGWPVADHLWGSKRNWGYGGLPKTKQEYIERYKESIDRLATLKSQGVAGAVYTQTTDVEGEINGLMTYDRDVNKIASAHLRQIAEDNEIVDAKGDLTASRPNIIVVLVDDMGYSDLGCYGSEIDTPNIDALAAGGLQFTQFYNQGRCCPTRASLMTGLQPHQAGIGHMTSPPGQALGIEGPYQGYLNDQCTTLASVLQDAGYATMMTGKWHLGVDRKECWPLQRGFQKYYGCLSGAINYFKPGGDRGLTEGNEFIKTPEGFYATDTFTDKAIEYLQAAKEADDDQPTFLYLAYNAPHWPLNAKWEDFQKYRGKYKQGWDAMIKARNERQRELGLLDPNTEPAPHPGPTWDSLNDKQHNRLDAIMAAYAGCLDSVDQNIGKLITHLKATGEYDNTVIFFLSDNGACQEGGAFGNGTEAMVKNPPLETTNGVRIGLHWAGACNTPYRKYKHFVHEGGACTPMIAHWPKGIPSDTSGKLVHQRAYLQDFMPTVIELAGGAYPNDVTACDGRSMVPLLAGDRTGIHFDPMFWEHEGNASVRMGQWKLVREYEHPWELYDLSNDRTEINDLAEQKPKLRDDMITMWEDWATKTGVMFPKRFNMYEFLQKKKQAEKN
ncbi:sulfatase-like hydrolase/transferase [Rhodopirellula sp. MGV]|uniref:sulfatase-like hydrolase/transferase n=1 Tax=Rhodopirellula sp. MGV TaxID=2023130 RepID=UPI000B97C1EE|nr:sulfatase-like hydrolase/transferase [Rhodopirellula sp. MGV]OYP35032.1 hypothetical protein CGZ80_13585 [Rhodopirellula sp. MGV]PNY35801.1 hypothetical protein C2E31_16350 [Rhodopirellula baltica]